MVDQSTHVTGVMIAQSGLYPRLEGRVTRGATDADERRLVRLLSGRRKTAAQEVRLKEEDRSFIYSLAMEGFRARQAKEAQELKFLYFLYNKYIS